MYKRTKEISSLLNKYIKNTPLEFNQFLSEKYNSNIYFKREDLQFSRSFKIRGSLNKILKNENNTQLVTASAGNHAQGVAYSCNLLNKQGTIFLPNTTTLQKINRIKYYGKDNIDIKIEGDYFTKTLNNAINYCKQNNYIFIHPYDDMDIIEGQSTIAHEIINEIYPDYILTSVGGGGLISGIVKYMDSYNNNTNNNNQCEIIGIEPLGASSLTESLLKKDRILLDNIDTFVDGASVSQIGVNNYEILKNTIKNTIIVSNPHISHELINMYQNEGIVLEPAGVMPICALETIKNDIKGKNVVCILSGGNNDLTRYNELMELNLFYLDLKHYFILDFIQKPNQLKIFMNKILKEGDDITRFEYIKKSNKNYGKVLIGIELDKKENITNIISNLQKYNYKFKKIEFNDYIYDLII